MALPSLQPAGRELLGKALEVPFNTVTNFGARFRGFLLPALSGSYVFWIDPGTRLAPPNADLQ